MHHPGGAGVSARLTSAATEGGGTHANGRSMAAPLLCQRQLDVRVRLVLELLFHPLHDGL